MVSMAAAVGSPFIARSIRDSAHHARVRKYRYTRPEARERYTRDQGQYDKFGSSGKTGVER